MMRGNLCLCTVLFLILVNVLSTVGDDHYDFPWCPTTVDQCYCRRKYNTDVYIYCEYIGNVRRIPDFNHSELRFKEVHFRFDTQINSVQRNSFFGLQVQDLRLQSLQIHYVDKDAFRGQEETLSHLHLDDNKIRLLDRLSISRLRKLQYIGLHNNLMESLPPLGDDFPELHYLYLFNNLIRVIPSGAFRGMGVLRGLKLNNNQIGSLQHGVFDPLMELRDLELQGNRLTTLPGNIFRNLRKLTKLDLSHNQIYLLLTNNFCGLGSLSTLHLNHNSLTEFQSGMFRCISRVKYLTLRNNYATSIEHDTFKNLKSIVTLDLSENMINRIEIMSFKRLYRLEKLYLRGNRLTQLDFFRDTLLGRIEILDLSNNNIREILDNETFKTLSKLEQLDLSGNLLGTIHGNAFRPLQFLKKLNLARNPLFELGEGVLSHLSLEELDMTYCQLKQIDVKAFSSLDNLQYLWLDHNELENIPTRLFNNTKNLNVLSLKNNSFQVLRRDMFKGLSKLEILFFDFNNLTNITDYSLVFLGSLRELSISHNFITKISEHSFNDLKMLVSLDLSYNRISSIGRGFTRFQNIETILLRGNKLRNLNWFSLYYSTLENLKLLDLSACDIERFYLDGLILSLKHSVKQFQLNVAENPLSCSGCHLSWMSYIPYSSIIMPIQTTCSKPTEVNGRPAFCYLDNPCMDEAIKNNTKLQTMCADAENISSTTNSPTTTEPGINSTTDAPTVYSDRSTTTEYTTGPVMLNTTEELNRSATAVVTEVNRTMASLDPRLTTDYDSSSQTEYLTVPEERSTTTMGTTIGDLKTENIDTSESTVGSGDADQDLFIGVGSGEQDGGLPILGSTEVEDDVIKTDEATSTNSYWSTEQTATTTTTTYPTTLLALLFTATVELSETIDSTNSRESTTSIGEGLMKTNYTRNGTDGWNDYASSGDEISNISNGSDSTEGSGSDQPNIPNKKMLVFNNSVGDTFKESDILNLNITINDSENMKKPIPESGSGLQSSGDFEGDLMKILSLDKMEPNPERTSSEESDSFDIPDEVLEEEGLLHVQKPTAPSSSSVHSADTMFSSGEPNDDLNTHNDGVISFPEYFQNTKNSSNFGTEVHLDSSSPPLIEEIEDKNDKK